MNKNNFHELDNIFFLPEEVGFKPHTFTDRMENIRSEYNHIEELDEVINAILKGYNSTSRNNIARITMLVEIVKLNRLIKSDKTVNNDDPLPF